MKTITQTNLGVLAALKGLQAESWRDPHPIWDALLPTLLGRLQR